MTGFGRGCSEGGAARHLAAPPSDELQPVLEAKKFSAVLGSKNFLLRQTFDDAPLKRIAYLANGSLAA